MHFGRVTSTEGLPLGLPSDPARTQTFLSLPLNGQRKIYCGCPVWGDKAWLGIIYPDHAKQRDFLRYYGEQFKTVELNSSFYHVPTPSQVSGWASEVPSDFRFSPKVNREISEKLAQTTWRPVLNDFCTAVAAFGAKLGLVFMQLPEWFDRSQIHLLRRFLEQWPSTLPLAVEFRHRSWFAGPALMDDTINLLYRHRASTVITDTLGCRYALHLSLTWPKVLIRFLGFNGDATDQQRLKDWATRLRQWQAHGLDEVYFYAHQADHLQIPATVDALVRLFNASATDEQASTLEPRRPLNHQRPMIQPSLGF